MQHQSPSSVLLNLVHLLPFSPILFSVFYLSLPVRTSCIPALLGVNWLKGNKKKRKQIENSTIDCSKKKKKIALVIAKLKYSLKVRRRTGRLPSWKDTLGHWLLLRFGRRTGQQFSLNMNCQNSHTDDLIIKVKTCVDTAKGFRKEYWYNRNVAQCAYKCANSLPKLYCHGF